MLPHAAMLLAVLGWTYSMIANKALVGALGPVDLVAIRATASCASLWLLLVLARQLRAAWRAGRWPLIMGIMEPGMVSLLSVWGLYHTTAVHAVILWALTPAIAPIISRITLSEKFGWPVWAGAALALAGTLILVGGPDPGGEATLFGDGLVLASVIVSAATQSIGRRIATHAGVPLATAALQTSVAVLLFGLLALIQAAPEFALPQLTAGQWAFAASIGIIGNAMTFVAFHYALKTMPVAQISLYVPLVAPAGAAAAALWLGEPLRANVFAALALMLLGVFLPMLWARLQRPPPRPELHAPEMLEPPGDDPRLARDLDELNFVVFDTETTGLRPTRGDEIVSLGALTIQGGGGQAPPFERLVNPGRRIPARTTRIHGITDDMVANAPPIGPVLRDFQAYVADGVLVAHNAAFDLLCLRVKEAETGTRFRGPALDTLLLAAWLDPAEPDLSLDGLLRRHGIVHSKRHDALADAEATAELFRQQLAAAKARGVRTLEELLRVSRTEAQLRARAHHFR